MTSTRNDPVTQVHQLRPNDGVHPTGYIDDARSGVHSKGANRRGFLQLAFETAECGVGDASARGCLVCRHDPIAQDMIRQIRLAERKGN